MCSDYIKRAEALRKCERLSDELAIAKRELAANPGHQAALRIQRIQQLRKQTQATIRPYLATTGKPNENPAQDLEA